MDDDVRTALESDRLIDITTIGKTSGTPRRIEIWFHRVDGRFYITGRPPRPRSWYANLIAHPEFTFHLTKSATADLPATARPITDPAERTEVLSAIFAQLPQLGANPRTPLSMWIAQAPLVEVTFQLF